MSSCATESEIILPDLPDKPYHPTKGFSFPRRFFGQTKPVQCSCKSHWFDKWPWLHYNEVKDVVFCHIYVTAFKLKKIMTSHNAALAFVSCIN